VGRWGFGPGRAAQVFAVANLAFLGGDILLAHAANAFARKEEWIPLVFSAIAPLALLPGAVRGGTSRRLRPLSLIVGGLAVMLGVVGMLYHLQSGFFAEQTLRGLVYAAPFTAPLAYVGLGLLVLLSELEEPATVAWSRWVVFLALGGFVGNFALSTLDHAQNGFFSRSEWIAVAASGWGIGFLSVSLARPWDVKFQHICLAVLGGEVLVGLSGFGLHLHGNLLRSGPSLAYKMIYGAPVFAPLLFVDLALLGGIGIWGLLGSRGAQRAPTAALEA
jgi:hypothetical protein